MGLPGTEWIEMVPTAEKAAEHLPRNSWQALPDHIQHTFTHFHLELGVIGVSVQGPENLTGEWIGIEDIDDQALPSVMVKAISHARKHFPSSYS